MSDSTPALLLLPLLWFVGVIVILQARYRRKAGGELWDVYEDLARGLGLEARVEVSAGYGLPDLVGRMRGRAVLIHPIVGHGSAGIPKTAYAAAHHIAFRGRVLITPSSVSRFRVGRYRHSLHVRGLSPYYDVTAGFKGDRELVHKVLSAKVVRGIDGLFSRSQKDTLSLFLGSGIVIFYTQDWQTNRETLGDCLMEVVGVADGIDEEGAGLPTVDTSPMFARLEGNRNTRRLAALGSGVVAAFGAVLAGISLGAGFDLITVFVFWNMAAILLLISVTRIQSAYSMRGRSRRSAGGD